MIGIGGSSRGSQFGESSPNGKDVIYCLLLIAFILGMLALLFTK